uniref:Uncharacterized protein n=1 Tax=Rhizophora mucronata TaxID=61149 RepID=A0A2P2P2V3_RHIMU
MEHLSDLIWSMLSQDFQLDKEGEKAH